MRTEFLWNVLRHEGGFSNHSSDRGGATFRGITWATYLRYCKKTGVKPTAKHHKNLTNPEVFSIYWTLYVEPYRVDEYVASWVKEMMFSAVIHHGGSSAAYMAQRAVNKLSERKVKLDGVVGSITLAAVNELRATIFVNEMVGQRIIFTDRIIKRTVAKGDLTQVDFLLGWHKRFLRFIRP